MKLNIFTLTLGLTLACAYTPQAQPADSCNPLSMLQERRSTCVLKFLHNGEYHIQKIDLKKILSFRNGMHHGINGLRELCDNSIVYVQRNTAHLIKNVDAIPFISAVLIGGALLFIIYRYKNKLYLVKNQEKDKNGIPTFPQDFANVSLKDVINKTTLTTEINQLFIENIENDDENTNDENTNDDEDKSKTDFQDYNKQDFRR